MALKFDESTGYYAIPDDAALSLPAGDWCIGGWVNVTDNTGDFFQYLFSNGGFLATSSLNFYIGEDTSGLAGDRGRWLLALKSDDGTTIQLGAGTTIFGADSTWRIVLVQYNSTAGAWELWTCAKDGTAELLESNVSAAKTVNGGAWNIGRRVDGNADRYFGEHACEFWVGNNFSLTQAEIEDLATGKRITDIGKSPALYYPAETADATLTDSGTSGLTATKNGTVTTSVLTHPVTAASGTVTITATPQAQAATASASLAVVTSSIGIEGGFDASNVDLATSSVSGTTVTLNPRLTTTESDSNKWGHWMARLTNVNGLQPTISVPEANNYLGVSNRAVWSYDRIAWTKFDNGTDTGTHREYSHNTAFNQNTVYVAKMEPFSETEMAQWLTDNDANQYLHETGSSTTFGGDKYQFNLTRTGDTDEKSDPVPQYKMHTFRISNDAQVPDDGRGKRRCVVWGGVHAGETSGSHAAIGLANYLLAAGDTVAQRLLKNFDFYFIPVVNASGRGAGHFRGTFENNLNTNREIGNGTIDVLTKAENAMIADTGGTCHVGLDFHGWKGALYQGYWDHNSTAATKWTDKLTAYTTFGTSGTQGAGGVWCAEYMRDVMGASFANTPEIGEDSVDTLTQMRVWGEYNARVIDDLWLDNEFQIPVLIDVLAAAANATCGCTVHPNRKSIRVNLVNSSGTPQTGLSNLKFALWDAATPDLIATVPSAKGADGATDGSGDLQFYADSSTLMPGQIGSLWVTDSDGNPVNNANSHAHPVAMDQE